MKRAEEIIQKVTIVIGRIALAYLFFTQLWWKAPPSFGCNATFDFAEEQNGRLKTTQGLCDWIGREAVYAQKPRQFFVADMRSVGGPVLQLEVSAITQANGAFLDGFVKPNIRWFGYVVFAMEAFIFVSLFFGLLSRLGGLVAIAQSAQLMIGLSGTPGEWEWIYHLMVALSLVMFGLAPGRVFGIDAWLRPMFQAAAEKGNKLGQFLMWLT